MRALPAAGGLYGAPFVRLLRTSPSIAPRLVLRTSDTTTWGNGEVGVEVKVKDARLQIRRPLQRQLQLRLVDWAGIVASWGAASSAHTWTTPNSRAAAALRRSTPRTTNSTARAKATKPTGRGRYESERRPAKASCYQGNCEESARLGSWPVGAQPFDSAVLNLRMNRAVARFTSSAPTPIRRPRCGGLQRQIALAVCGAKF